MKKKPSHPMLRKYTVTIEEQIVQEFPVEAYDLSHALETAEAAYKQGELVVQPSAPTTRLIMARHNNCLLYTSPSPRDRQKSRMPSSA